MPTEIWLLATAVIFTILGWRMGKQNTIEQTIDALIAGGYLRHKKDKDGEIEVLKWNSLEDHQN